MDGSAQHLRAGADGQRGRRLGGAIAVHARAAPLPEHGRRHLRALGLPRDPPGGRRAGQHHLQDPLQRRGGDDRGAAGGLPPVGARNRAPDRGRGRGARRGACRGRRALAQAGGRISVAHQFPLAHRARRRAARAARRARRHRADLRSGLRHRAAPAHQTRACRRAHAARVHPSGGVRKLRRLHRAVQLRGDPPARHAAGAQAPDRSIRLQSRLRLPGGELPGDGHRGRRGTAQESGRRSGQRSARARDRGTAGAARLALDRALRPGGPASAAPASSPSAR